MNVVVTQSVTSICFDICVCLNFGNKAYYRKLYNIQNIFSHFLAIVVVLYIYTLSIFFCKSVSLSTYLFVLLYFCPFVYLAFFFLFVYCFAPMDSMSSCQL